MLQRKNWLIPLTLTLVTLAAYSGVMKLEFVDLDDPDYVYKNSYVVQGLNFQTIQYAFRTFDMGNYIPLTWLSLLLDVSLFGRGAQGLHLTNLVLHLLNVLLLYYWLRQLTDATWRSAALALLFAVHPLHVESVAWISERKDVLSTLFCLLSLIVYTRYCRGPSVGRYVGVAGLFLLGLLAKPMLVTLPLLLLLIDVWPLGRLNPGGFSFPPQPGITLITPVRAVAEKIPLLLLSFFDGLLTIYAQKASGAVSGENDLTWAEKLGNASQGLAFYIWKTFIPTGLIPMYPHPGPNLNWMWVYGSLCLALLITFWVWRGRGQAPWRLWGWLWYVISVLPVLGVMQVGVQAYADRYSYVPQIGLLLIIVWELAAWATRVDWGCRALAVAVVIASAICIPMTRAQVRMWKDPFTLWSTALQIAPENWYVQQMLGSIYLERDERQKALELYEASYRSDGKTMSSVLGNYGLLLYQLERRQEAELRLREALAIDDKNRYALMTLAKLLNQKGEKVEARQILEYAIRVLPPHVNILNELGLIELSEGHPDRALPLFQQAVVLSPNSSESHLNLGVAYGQLGRIPESKLHFQRAVELNPEDVESLFALGQIAEFEKNLPAARDYFAAVARLNPQHPQAPAKVTELDGLLKDQPPVVEPAKKE
ncbi:tetratricopeptide repeat protein [Planctomicrobium sp. SH664]|uniref:tetratricopeptide repeat protein n=1 Tax=Planctomicrobium sp. SH664 TaxID=3448125 RepID=UPI003F5C87EF